MPPHTTPRPVLMRRTIAVLCSIVVLSSTPAFASGLFDAPKASPELGKSIYNSKCAQCHGESGKGNGPAAAMLYPRPRDFTEGKFKIRSTESGSIPTDEDLLFTIRHGLPGSAMSDWQPFIGGDSLMAVLDYMKSLSSRFAKDHPKRVSTTSMIPLSAESIAAGKKAYLKLQCASCHGTDGVGTDAVATDLVDDAGMETHAANLTEPWTFRGGPEAKDIYMRLRTGMDGSPMPSFKAAASEAELKNVANYVASLARKPVWAMNADQVKAFYDKQDKESQQNPIARGKYLVRSFGCAFCHSPLLESGSIIEEFRYAGGQKMNLYPFGTYVTYNLTSDKETGLGGWTDQQIKTFITSGVRRDGSRMVPFPMPWASYAGLKDEDLNAIIAFLRTIPPVYNQIPLPKSEGFFSYMWGKFQLLILKRDIPAYTYPGNAGLSKEKAMSSNDVRNGEVKP